MKKKLVLVVGVLFMTAVTVFAQAKIPTEFWTFPMKGINPVLAELYAASQGRGLTPFNIDPTPEILFNQLELKSVTQMDGTTIKTVKGKTTLSGNTVSVELLTYNGSALIIKSTISIYCNMQAKENYLARLQIVPTSGDAIDVSVSSYDMYNDSQAATDLAQFFTIYGQFFKIWYTDESVKKYLRS